MNGVNLEGRTLIVQPANFDSPPPPMTSTAGTQPSYKKPPQTKPNPQPKSSLRDHRSYMEASIPKTNPTHDNQPNPPEKEFEKGNSQSIFNLISPNILASDPNPIIFAKEPSGARIASSKILGEDTMEARENVSAEEIEEEFSLIVEGIHKNDNEELFKRSVFAVAISSQSSSEILDSILSEGVNSMVIKPMGGLLHLLTFDSIEEKIAMVESGWLEKWFMMIRDINNAIAAQWRQTSLKIHGVPITAWNYENFHKLSSVFGRVISIDYSNFDCAKVLLISDCLFRINCKMYLKMDEGKYPIFVFEEDQHVVCKGHSCYDRKKDEDSDDDVLFSGEEEHQKSPINSPRITESPTN